jgi:hypothetical protein
MILAMRFGASVLLIGLLAYVVTNLQPVSRIDARLGLAILAAQPALVLTQLQLAWRFKLAVNRPQAGLASCLAANLFGQASDVVLPWRLSELVRVVHLRQGAGIPVSVGLSTAFLERSADLLTVAALALAAAGLALVKTSAAPLISVAAIGVVLAVLPPLAPLLERFAGLIPVATMRRLAISLLHELVVRLKDGTLLRIAAPTLGIWGSALIATWAFLATAEIRADGLTVPATFTLALVVFVLTTFGNVLAVLPASIGTYEAAVVIALRIHGVPFDEGFAIGFALHLAHLAIGVIGGALVAAFGRVRIEDVMRDIRRVTSG